MRTRNLGLLALLGVCWGAHVSVSKVLGAQSAVESLAYLSLYMAGTVVALGAVAVLGGRPGARWRIRLGPSLLIFFAISGFFSYFAPLWAELAAAPKIDAALFSLIEAFGPAISATLAAVFALERVTKRRACAVALIVVAGIMLTKPGATTLTPDLIGWAAVAALVPLSYAITDLYIQAKWPEGLGLLPLSAGEAAAGLLLSLIVALAFGVDGPALVAASAEWPLLLALTVANVGTALLAIYLLRAESAVFVSFAGILALFVGVLAGVFYFGERPSPQMWAAAALVVGSMWLLNRSEAPEPHAGAPEARTASDPQIGKRAARRARGRKKERIRSA